VSCGYDKTKKHKLNQAASDQRIRERDNCPKRRLVRDKGAKTFHGSEVLATSPSELASDQTAELMFS